MIIAFKFVSFIKGSFYNQDTIILNFPGRSNLSFKIEKIPENEEVTILKEKKFSTNCRCTVYFERNLNKKNTSILQQLNDGLTPKEFEPGKYDTIRNFDPYKLYHYPEYFTSFCKTITDEGIGQTKNIFNYLRWRYNIRSTHNPLIKVSHEFSIDKVKWIAIPKEDQFFVDLISHVPIEDGDKVDIIKEITNNIYEPLQHDLFRESWAQRITNKRSALILGVSSLETGIKHCISVLSSDSKWLIENVQSPPIYKLLIEYVPTLQVRNKLKDRSILPPKSLLQNIEKGISMRNDIVHGNPCNIEVNQLEDILRSIKYVLYLVDLYCGKKWAVKHLNFSGISNFNLDEI